MPCIECCHKAELRAHKNTVLALIARSPYAVDSQSACAFISSPSVIAHMCGWCCWYCCCCCWWKHLSNVICDSSIHVRFTDQCKSTHGMSISYFDSSFCSCLHIFGIWFWCSMLLLVNLVFVLLMSLFLLKLWIELRNPNKKREEGKIWMFCTHIFPFCLFVVWWSESLFQTR